MFCESSSHFYKHESDPIPPGITPFICHILFLFAFYLLVMIQVVFLRFFADSLAPMKQPFSSLSIRLKVGLFILFTLSYIASHGLASSYLGDLLGFFRIAAAL